MYGVDFGANPMQFDPCFMSNRQLFMGFDPRFLMGRSTRYAVRSPFYVKPSTYYAVQSPFYDVSGCDFIYAFLTVLHLVTRPPKKQEMKK